MDITETIDGLPSARSLRRGLLRKHFFPNVKNSQDDLPPYFSSATMTWKNSSSLRGKVQRHSNRFGYVQFRTRRFDGLIRSQGLAHPVAYVEMVDHIYENWGDFRKLLASDESRIRIRKPGRDKRLIDMNYDSAPRQQRRNTNTSIGKRYLVTADISKCYPSIYSHAIDWAIRTRQTARANQNQPSLGGKTDRLNMAMHGGETHGLMIGPGTSAIMAELVLQRIDALLRKKYEFVRYIDDYTAYFHSFEEAEQFIRDLDDSLSQYRLLLNTRKTGIINLEGGVSGDWISRIFSRMPNRSSRGSELARFVQYAEREAIASRNNSILTFALKVLLNSRSCPTLGKRSNSRSVRRGEITILSEMLRVAFFHPHIAPIIARQLAFSAPRLKAHEAEAFSEILSELLNQSLRRNETDTSLWYTYCVANILNRPIPRPTLEFALNSRDDLILVAYAGLDNLNATEIANNVRAFCALGNRLAADLETKERLDQHWLIRYELYRTGYLGKRDVSHIFELPWFNEAVKSGIRFTR